MHYPNITFRKSPKKDFETLRAFVKDAKYDNGRNLNWAVFKKYPHLKMLFNSDKHYKIKNEKELRYFIYETYRSKSMGMGNDLVRYKKYWKKIAPYYFSIIDDFFSGRKWPLGKYIAFGTIWGMYPRFLNDKTFQIPYKNTNENQINVIIAHELLHFMFYNYLFSKYPKYKSDKYDFFVWHVSEIFNSLVQNSTKWTKVFKSKSKSYPEHKHIIKTIEKKHHKSHEWAVDDLIQEIIEHVTGSSLVK